MPEVFNVSSENLLLSFLRFVIENFIIGRLKYLLILLLLSFISGSLVGKEAIVLNDCVPVGVV
jgi:hypothetical protein